TVQDTLIAPQISLLKVHETTVDAGVKVGALGGRGQHIYQWQKSTDNGETYYDIDGARTASLVQVGLPSGHYKFRIKVKDGSEPPVASYSNALEVVIDR